MLYSVGDVVRSYYYWITNGQKQGIVRPVIIKEIKENNYIVVKISRSKRDGLLRIVVRSKEWKVMGLYDYSKDSYVDKSAIQLISEREIQRKIGECPQNMLFFRVTEYPCFLSSKYTLQDCI